MINKRWGLEAENNGFSNTDIYIFFQVVTSLCYKISFKKIFVLNAKEFYKPIICIDFSCII